jgi:ABC-2 type transport system permease protein/lipopolysaccharide transport system permease protein
MTENISRITIYDSRKKQTLAGYLAKCAGELGLYRYAYYNFVRNNLSTRYRRSVLGFFWTLINPLINLTILAVVFSLVFRQDIRSFGVYIFSALSPWTFIAGAINQSPMTFISAESYLKKVYVPKFIFPLTLVSVEGVNFFFSMVSIYIIFVFLGAKLSWVMLLTPLAMLITFLFVLGVTITIGVINVYFRDVAHITNVVISALFYTIPIMYPISMIPDKYRILFAINPFYHFIHLYRILLYDTMLPTWQEWLIPLGIAIVALLVGFFVLMKQDLDLVFRL